jgi:hypothetical protein
MSDGVYRLELEIKLGHVLVARSPPIPDSWTAQRPVSFPYNTRFCEFPRIYSQHSHLMFLARQETNLQVFGWDLAHPNTHYIFWKMPLNNRVIAIVLIGASAS